MGNEELNDLLHMECKECGRILGMHRLTQVGNTYCLELNPDAQREVEIVNRFTSAG